MQKDQRRQLQSHSAKCVFIGYPTQYKGWLFWNPSTYKEIISDSAVFDERSFSGTSRTPVQLTVHIPDTSDLPEQGGVEIDTFEPVDVLSSPQSPERASDPISPENTQTHLQTPSDTTQQSPAPSPPPVHPTSHLGPNMYIYTPLSPVSPPPAKHSTLDPSTSFQPRSRVHYPVARPFAGEWDKMINPLMHYPGRHIPRPAAAPSVHNSVPTPTPDPEAVSQPEEDVHMDSESDDPLDLISEDSVKGSEHSRGPLSSRMSAIV